MVRLIFRAFVLLGLSFGASFGVSDMLGREVNVQNTDKIVFIGPGALRLGVYLGVTDRVVGIEAREKRQMLHAPYNAVVKAKKLDSKPTIGEGGPGKMPTMEALIASGAELIVASFVSKENMDLIEQKTKIPVFGVDYGDGKSAKSMDLVKKSILNLGEILGVKARANELVEFMNSEEKAFKGLNLSPKSLYIGGVSYKGSWGIASTEGRYLPFELLGVANAVAKGQSGHLFLDLEKIAEVDPDIVFVDVSGEKIITDEINNKKEFFDSLKAFKTGQIYKVAPFNFYNTNIENCYFIAWQVASKLGAKVDLDAKKAEIYKKFLGEF